MAMQRLHFCSGMTFVTGDEISSAVILYVQAVAITRGSDVLTVPAVGAGSGARTVTLLVNSASQISSESIAHEHGELRDEEFVLRVSRMTADLIMPDMYVTSDLFEGAQDQEA
jgi:hypothetical protein